ncbi:MAG: hypothetical protein Q7S88_02575 [Candidatus Daviesbacteria bacterium]|nr:hypothetical protein [Candidatus Daviesbacteria bacterium]
MKVTLLIGPGEVGKRQEFSRIKKQFGPNLTTLFDLKQNSLEEINRVLSSRPLFDTGERLIVLENVPDKFDLRDLVLSETIQVVILAGSPKATSLLIESAKAERARVLTFEGEKETSAFLFLDLLLEQKKQAFEELEKLLEEYGWMYVLTMIYYGLRRNLLPLPSSEFARRKIVSQKAKYKLEDLQARYLLTLETEYGLKSGTISEKIGLSFLVERFTS